MAKKTGGGFGRGQDGMAGLMAALMTVLVLTASAVAYNAAVGTASRGGSETGARSRVEAAARAGLDWARIQAKKGECAETASFTGASAIPAFADLTVKVTCLLEPGDKPAYNLESIACTHATCPGTGTLPAGYAEKALTARISGAGVTSRQDKAALIETIRRMGPTMLLDFEENSLESQDFNRPDAAASLPDPVLFLRMEGADKGASFPDSSPSAKDLTVVGAPTTSTAGFVKGQSAAQFPGNAVSYLQTPASSDFDLSASDATVDFWMKPYLPVGGGWNRPLSAGTNGATGSWSFGMGGDGGLSFGINYSPATGVACPAGTLKSGQWHHVAATLSGTTAKIYVNGRLCGSQSAFTRPSAGAVPLNIGIDASIGLMWGQAAFQGFLDDVRVTRGVRWASDFSPGRSGERPNTAYSLNMQFDGHAGTAAYRDTSSFRRAVTATAIGDGYRPTFNGANHITVANGALDAFGTGDFTVASWVVPSRSGVYQRVVNNWGAGTGWMLRLTSAGQAQAVFNKPGGGYIVLTGGASAPVGGWTYLALTRKGDTFYLFHNGALSATESAAGVNLTDTGLPTTLGTCSDLLGCAGESYAGVLEGVTIVKGTALWTAGFQTPGGVYDVEDNLSMPPALQLDFDGANGSTAIVDSSANPKAITSAGSVSVTTTGAPVGTGAGVFSGSSYLALPAHADWAIGTGDLTLEGWVKFAQGSMGREACLYDGGTSGLLLCKSAANRLSTSLRGVRWISLDAGPAVSAGEWTHFAWSRNAGANRLFVNGVLASTVADAADFSSSAGPTIGALAGGASPLDGQLDDLRYTPGRGIYTSDFTPPGGVAAQAGVLLHMDEDGTAATLTDSFFGQAVNRAGTGYNGSHSRFGGKSRFFDGPGWVEIPGANWSNWGAGDFTVDFWFKSGATNAYATMAGRHSGINNWIAGDWIVTLNGGSGDGRPNVWCADAGCGSPLLQSAQGGFNDDAWHHLAWVRGGGTNRLYIDGQLQASNAGYAATVSGASPLLAIGNDTSTTGRQFSGHIDEFRIVPRADWSADFTPPKGPYAADGSWSHVPVYEKMGMRNGTARGAVAAGQSLGDVKGMGFASVGDLVSLDMLRTGSLAGGATLVALARPTADFAASTDYGRLIEAGWKTQGGASNFAALMHDSAAGKANGATGNAAGTWNGASSAAGALAADAWTILATASSSAGATVLYKDGEVSGSATTQAIADVHRPENTVGNSSNRSATDQYFGGMGVAAVFGRPITSAEAAAMQDAWANGTLPSELKFRSDDASLADRLGNGFSASTGVSADASMPIGPTWAFGGGAAQRLAATSADFAPGSGDFTVEMLMRPDRLTGAGGWTSLIDLGVDEQRTGGFSLRLDASGNLALVSNGMQFLSTTMRPIVGRWNHVAIQRKAGQTTIRLNGVASAAATFGGTAVEQWNYSYWTTSTCTGGYSNNGWWFYWVKGGSTGCRICSDAWGAGQCGGDAGIYSWKPGGQAAAEDLAVQRLSIGSANEASDPSGTAAFAGRMREIRVWKGVAIH